MAEVHRLPLQHVKKKLPSVNLLLIASFLFTLWLLGLVSPADAFAAETSCSQNQFRCKDGSCILREKMCDGRQDCSDGSDENDCDFKLCQKPRWFQCSEPHGPCLSSDLICNGVQNCPGGEDEQDCVGGAYGSGRSKPMTTGSTDVGTGGWHSGGVTNCSEFEYTCQNDKACIPLDFMCDGKGDCRDNSDETAGCIKAAASCKGFFCANKKCLESYKWRCDGVDDCGDGSDELNCFNICNPDNGKFLCANNATCIELTKVCNGDMDCPDSSDESSRCSSPADNCATKSCPPASKCKMFPNTGPECLCPAGYRYSVMQKACLDINECDEMYGICSQLCQNTPGKYKCSCDEGYFLLPDNKTCRVQDGEGLLLYSTQITVMGVHLESKRVYTVAKNLTKVIGVSFDGENIYWTNIQNDAESIVRSKADGTEQEILLTTGLDAPEDLAVDWLTDNIYFTDNILRHIAVCSNGAHNCAVLVTLNVHQPRGIALWPQRGQMFWTDWGTVPMIVRASMDGERAVPIVTENIHWPNGIALDLHNNRVYWVDAKVSTMESVRPDGTDRRVVLDEILKHPYGIGVFEDHLYWSDWGTKSIHMCNKFTGKDHQVLTKDRTIYAVHVYHPAKQPKTEHACQNNRCSHMCLLAENNSHSCACPEGMLLSVDRMRCIKTQKKQRLFMGMHNTLLEMEHTTFGRHVISQTHHLPRYISEMTYNSVNGTIIVADNVKRELFEYDLTKKIHTTLVHGNLGNISALAFDHLAHNVYWSDLERGVIEVLSLRTMQRAIVCFFTHNEKPVGLAIVPEDGIMFVALRSRRHVHVDQKSMSGQGEHVHVFEDELGDKEINFAVEYETKTLYWADSDLGRISFSDYRNLHAYTFRGRLKRPYSIAIVDEDLFWTEQKSSSIFWTHKSNIGPLKRIEIELAKESSLMHVLPSRIPLLASTPARIEDHPCQHANGECSHICVSLGKFAKTCLCPAGLVFKDATNRTCIEALDCEFRCRSGDCLTLSRRCNGRKECPDGSDEEGCDASNSKSKLVCSIGQSLCHDGKQCFANAKRCDGHKDCKDASDELHCEKFDKTKKCHSHQHACDNGNCVDFSVMCDGSDDCGDNSDESNCKVGSNKGMPGRPVCDKNMFQCNSGTCIAQNWECDGKLDCTDGSDEHEKCTLKECPPNMHKCLLGQCIDMRMVCDEHNDCGDYSDELNCDYLVGKRRKIICGDAQHPMYQCSSEPSMCLPLSAKCNGTAECPRGEDEADCGAICSIYEFQCTTTKECIRMEFRCDHDKDCSDGSDELNCNRDTNRTTTTHERVCEAHMFDCKDGRCVDMTRVCDGFPDCDTSADEGPLCKTACKQTSNRPICEHRCRATPMGAVCSCFEGYKLDTDHKSCMDTNECEEQDPCSQKCVNTHGSYKCGCFPDFMLRPDKTTCKSLDSNFSLLFTSYNEVRSITEQPVMLRVAWSANDSKITGFDVDVRKRLGYFTTDSENVLYQVDVETGIIKAALSVELPTKVAVDWITENVFVISRTKRYEIKICSFKAKMCGSIIQTNPRETIKALTVDAFNRRLFYITLRSKSFGLPVSQVNSAYLDGKHKQVLHTKNGAYITALTTDPYKEMLYYVDQHTKTLQAISYKPGSTHTSIMVIQKGNMLVHPSSITIFENQAFIVNIGAKEAVRCQLFGTRVCKAFNLNIMNAEDIVVDGASRQPVNNDPCAMAQCSAMCIQSEFGYECMCGDEIVSEKHACDHKLTNEITMSALLNNSANSAEPGAGHHTVFWSLFMLTLLLLIAGAGYLYYRRIKQGHRDLNINLHFQNPLSTLGANKSATAPSSSSGASNTDGEHRRLQFGIPFHNYLRGAPTSMGGGTEILLETSKPNQVRTFASAERTPNLMGDDDADFSTAGAPNGYDDDARVRLVP